MCIEFTIQVLKEKNAHVSSPVGIVNFFNLSFLSPALNPQFWASRKRFMCLISWERTQKGEPHKLFWGDFWAKKGAPNGQFSARKS